MNEKEEVRKEIINLIEEAGWEVNIQKISEENGEAIVDVFVGGIFVNNRKTAINLNYYLKELGLGVRLIGGQIRIKLKNMDELKSKIEEICHNEVIIREVIGWDSIKD